MGYMSQPKAAAMRPGLVVVHDVAGLSNGVRGLTRNLSNNGYSVVAPDFLSLQGGTAGFRGNDAEIQKAVLATTAPVVADQATAAIGYVKGHGGGGGKGVGVIGFGWGGTQALLFAAGRKDIAACVAFYPDPKLVLPALPKIAVPTLIVFAADDATTKEGAAGIEQAAAAGKHTVKVYPGVLRNFHDPAAGAKVYNAAGAKEAWTAVVQHLDQNLKDPAKDKPRATGA
jgi:carboxymethylenebutenolidase